jgi:magnesium chelatase subunit D
VRTFPLSAIVGQELLIEALLINAVAPDVGGVLIRGERGTAKSTAVRGFAPLLPDVIVAEDQQFAFAPGETSPTGQVPDDAPTETRPARLVELPLGTTMDRLVGALDLRQAMAGEYAFEPGLLAAAHAGVLYVDEVNLLPDHLIDALLDSAASGICRVERDAVSVVHTSRFLLVGTMNPEEGELRPQLLDRFGLSVEVTTPLEPVVRAEIVRRRVAFDTDPERFDGDWRANETGLTEQITRARQLYPRVVLPERELLRITTACAKLGLDGVRGDITCARAARALAALDGRAEVDSDDVRRGAALAFGHRLRRDPLDQTAPAPQIDEALDHDPPEPPDHDGGGNGRPPSHAPSPAADPVGSQSATAGEAPVTSHEPAPDAQAPAPERLDAPKPASIDLGRMLRHGSTTGRSGRTAHAVSPETGSIDSIPARADDRDIAVAATIRSRLAGAHQLRAHVRAGRSAVLLCFVVDASGSMGARHRLARAKGALLELFRDAYARRDRVSLIAFQGNGARELVRPGAPIEQAAAAVAQLPTGGRTPLAAGLEEAVQVIERERRRQTADRAVAVILTDGRSVDAAGRIPAAAAQLGRIADAVHVIDTEEGAVRLGLAAELAAAAGASLHVLARPRPNRRSAA